MRRINPLLLALLTLYVSAESGQPPHQSSETSSMIASIPLALSSPTSSSSSTAAAAAAGAINVPLNQREVVQGPPEAQPTQVSPTMTYELDGVKVVYTQKFTEVPDQWPLPSKGTIGLGRHTKTAGGRE